MINEGVEFGSTQVTHAKEVKRDSKRLHEPLLK